MDDKLKLAREKIDEIDCRMRELFVERLKVAETVAEYKKDHGLDILDPKREAEVIRRNSEAIKSDVYRRYYISFQKNTMSLSRQYQTQLLKKGKENRPDGDKNNTHLIAVDLGENSYEITVGKNLLKRADEYLDLDRNVFIITDSGVPHKYAETIKNLCKEATVFTIREGEASKSLATLEAVLCAMSDAGLCRSDCVVAVGGGVVGDLSGLAASIYMRGIDFYNLPTTLLSQVDSSIGGKTAVNLGGIKNIVGTFKQPKAVLIDTEVLSTLPERHKRNGLSEVIKMAATSNAQLFERLEALSENDIYDNIVEIIVEALRIKKSIVETDERENDQRRILNFGHSLGHGIEASEDLCTLLHGECVALGMLPLSFASARERIKALLKKFNLPTEYYGDIGAALEPISHDKKCSSGVISVIICEEIGSCKIENISTNDFKTLVKKYYI